jgi:aryl-alcohol dehydrogenase-like predicted oxidoreductase
VLIGPRTPEQLADLLPLADVRLDGDTLAAIDAIVAPGTDVNPLDAGYTPHWLDPVRLRA